MVRKLSKVKATYSDTMWKSLNWVVISSEKNWRLQLDVSISMLWSSSGEKNAVLIIHIWHSITDGNNLRRNNLHKFSAILIIRLISGTKLYK